MKFSIRFLSFLAALCLASLAAGQGTVRGTLFDDANGEAIPFANVIIEGTGKGCATDLNGFFLIGKVPAGRHEIRVRFMGYEEYRDSVIVYNGRVTAVTIRLRPSAHMLQTVEIKDSRAEERRMQTQVSVEKITASQIQRMPSIGGQADIAQYMQVLPGVSSTGDQGGQLYIRGGSMIQNLCLLDGMVVYNPFHSIGLYSIFETDIILNADIYTGGFGAEYGGRMSSVMDIKTRDGNKRRHSGKVGLNTFGASLILEGPLKRERPDSKSTVTYLLAAKNSFLSKSWPLFYAPLYDAGRYPSLVNGLPFDFTDVYAKLSLNSGTGSKASVFGFRFDDAVIGYQAVADYHWLNYGAGANFSVVTGESAILEGTVAWSDYRITLDDGSSASKFSEIGGFNATLQITNFIGANRLRFGISMEGYNTDYEFTNQYGQHTTQEVPSTSLSAFATYKWKVDNLLVDPGIRMVFYSTLNSFNLEPRLALKYNASDRLRVKFAGGFYSQVFLDARSDNDIVNLFSGFLTGTSDLNLPSSFRGDEVTTCVQKAKHLVAGVEYDLSEHVTLNAEVYYKRFDQLINSNRDKMFDENDSVYRSGPYAKPEYLLKDFIIEDGYAMGFDLSATADLERLYLWATYSLGYVRRRDEVREYNPHYDRRHTVNLLATYALGKDKEWELSGRWTFGSGFPFTQTQGVYQSLQFGDGIGSDYVHENGNYSLHYAEVNKGRLPNYHRLDIGVKRLFSIGKRGVLELSANVTNVYNRKNIFYFNRTTYERVNQLPILVCLGATMTF